MSNELVKVDQLPVTEIMSIGKAFAESGMFPDTKSAAQAVVKIQAGQEIGIPPFAAMTGIHIIQGKPTIGAGLIASRLKGSGKYDYKIIKHDKTICSIEIYQAGKLIGTSNFTKEDAAKAGTKNMDKFPENMLFARAISNAVRWFAPDIFSGPVYTPEEMGDAKQPVEDIPHEEVSPVPEPKKQLSDKALTSAIIRINKGETELAQKLLDTYELTEVQIAVLSNATENAPHGQPA